MKSKMLFSAIIYSLIGVLMLFQTNVVLAIASDPNNPITAAITSAIGNLNPSPSTNPSPDPTPIPSASSIATSSAAPIATPIATASAQPISSPITSDPTTCLDFWLFQICIPDFISPPISIPIVNPTPTPSASASATPTPSATPSPTLTPTPQITPVISSIFPNPANWGTVVTITGSNLENSTQIYINSSLLPSTLYKPASEDNSSLQFTLPSYVDLAAGQTYKLYVVSDNVKSNELNLSIGPSVRPDMATASASQVLIDPQVNLDSNHPEMLLSYSNFNVNMSVPKSVTNPTLNFSNLLISSTTSKQATFNNILNINADTDLGTVKVAIPTSTTITGPLSWTGIINAPKTLTNAQGNPLTDKGFLATTQSVIEVGLGDTPLIFDKGVRILIPGQAGKLVGFQRNTSFYKITQSCTEDSQTAGNNLPSDGDCYISVGNDLVIWTKHFTKFVTYTESLIEQTSPKPNSNSSVNNSPAGAPVCGDTKPGSAPKLLSAKVTGRNEVTLTWSKAADPVTYYLVAYGTKSDKLEYGNPNIGGKDTNTYVVKGLQNDQTYYFKVRAGNSCMPGEFSNEVAVKASGDYISGPATGFKAGVLSTQRASSGADLKFKPITKANPQRVFEKTENIFDNIVSFISFVWSRLKVLH